MKKRPGRGIKLRQKTEPKERGYKGSLTSRRGEAGAVQGEIGREKLMMRMKGKGKNIKMGGALSQMGKHLRRFSKRNSKGSLTMSRSSRSMKIKARQHLSSNDTLNIKKKNHPKKKYSTLKEVIDSKNFDKQRKIFFMIFNILTLLTLL